MIADAINDYAHRPLRQARRQRAGFAHRRSSTSRTASRRRASIAELENLIVESDAPARVVVDERTGTIVIGKDVRISQVAISHGTLTVRITEMPTRRPAGTVLQGRDRRRALHRRSRPTSPTPASRCSTGPTSKRWSPASTGSASSRTASSRSCRASSRPAPCRPIWFCNRRCRWRSQPHSAVRNRRAGAAALALAGAGLRRSARRRTASRRRGDRRSAAAAEAGTEVAALLLQHRRRRARPALCPAGQGTGEAARPRSTSA